MVLLHPDDGSVESWTAAGSADKMRADFSDFEPRCVLKPDDLKDLTSFFVPQGSRNF